MNDLRFALRQLLKTPGFTTVAVLSLTLGIGVNVMLFSFFNAYLFRPVPLIQDPHRIVEIDRGDLLGRRGAFSLSEYGALTEDLTVLSGLLAYTGPHGGTLILGDGPARRSQTGSVMEGEEIRAKLVSGNYFSVLGVNAALGRTFLPEETRTSGSPPVAVLSHSLWQR